VALRLLDVVADAQSCLTLRDKTITPHAIASASALSSVTVGVAADAAKPTRRQLIGRYKPPDKLMAFLAGRLGALPRRAPLRTGRAAFTASGSSKPRELTGGQKLPGLCQPRRHACGGSRRV
jgi:hypothetical protein